MMESGVYKITSPSGNMYVGSAANGFEKRWRVHRHHLKAGTHHSAALQSAWNKYGEAFMVFSKLLICSRQMVLVYEQCAIDAYKPKYNMRPKAGNSSGWKHTPESRAKMSAQRRGVKQTPERVAARVAKVTGMKRPQSAIDATAAAKRGVAVSEETKRKISEKLLGKKRGPMSDETKAKIGLANLGKKMKKHSEEANHRNSERAKAMWATRKAALNVRD